MNAQRHIFDPGPATGNLTDKQTLVLELLTARPAGIRSGEIGAQLHQARGASCACSETVQCKFAFSEGERVGKQLRKLDLAIKRKTGLWQLIRPPVTGHDPATAEIPF